MSILYELKVKNGLIPLPPDEESSSQTVGSLESAGSKDKNKKGPFFVRIYTPEELKTLEVTDSDLRDGLLHLSYAHGSFANLFPNCIIGSLSFPDSNAEANIDEHFGFYLDNQTLAFVDSTGHCKETLESLTDLRLLPKMSTARVLYELMKFYIEDDPILMADLEKTLNNVETRITEHSNEAVTEDHIKITNNDLVGFRRKIMNYDRLYQQLTDLATTISKDDYDLLSKDDRRLFHLFEQRSERLFQRTQYLKEYSLQLIQLHQIQLETQQSKAIQWLTVVTSLIVPLTFITSWYGMNFHYMPELEFPYAYFIVVGVCLILVVLQLIFFKKRKWL